MRRAMHIGGYVAGPVLIVFGIVVIALSIVGYFTVNHELSQEKIVGSDDMTPTAIKQEAAAAGLSSDLDYPSCNVAGKSIDTGREAACFAEYMRIHALEASGGLTYSELPRYATADGKGTNDAEQAQKGPDGKPLDNPVRQTWITETALTTALNMSFFATLVAIFGVIVGIALLLTGVGFVVLTAGGAIRGQAPSGAPQAATAPREAAS